MSDTPVEPTKEEASLLASAKSWLGRYVRVTASDGRVLVGKLWCLDAHGNIILMDTEEYKSPEGAVLR